MAKNIFLGAKSDRLVYTSTGTSNLVASEHQLFLVVGTGHCGTKWLSSVLHRPYNKMVCYHEKKLRKVPLNWKDCLQHEFENGIDGLFNEYFSFMRAELCKYSVVGDSNSWAPHIIPDVAAKLPISKIIFLVP